MHIRYGYTIDVVCDGPAEFVTRLDIHTSRRRDITEPDDMRATALTDGRAIDCNTIEQDEFGNLCRRLAVPAGGVRLAAQGIVYDSGFTDPPRPSGRPLSIDDLPTEVRPFLADSPLCATSRFQPLAATLLSGTEPGWAAVKAIVDHVHGHLRFDRGLTRAGRTAEEAFDERTGTSSDFAQVAIGLCRAAGIPARYRMGYHAHIGIEPQPETGFSAWFDAYLDGRWWAFDALTNTPGIGRILVAQGRDSGDVPMIASPVPYQIEGFEIIAEEVTGARFPVTSRERRDRWAGRQLAEAGKDTSSR